MFVKHIGNFNKTERFLANARRLEIKKVLEKYAKTGVAALSGATPVDTGETASMWSYEIAVTRSGYSINWTNSNVVDGVPIVVLLQYGHGTGSGAYIQGRDFINPAISPIMDAIAENLWKEVQKL